MSNDTFIELIVIVDKIKSGFREGSYLVDNNEMKAIYLFHFCLSIIFGQPTSLRWATKSSSEFKFLLMQSYPT
jgi:hypothetical protein